MTATSARTRPTDRPMSEGERHEMQTHAMQTQAMQPQATMQPQAMQPISPQAGDETKPSLKTTEFYIYLAAVAGVLLASLLVGQGQTGDAFGANQAWWFVTLLTIGYLISRGLAKAGSFYRYRAQEVRR